MSTRYDINGHVTTDAALPRATATYHACGCIGPQRGEPYCPCRMRGVIERDGRWIEPERDLGPVLPSYEPLLGSGRNLADATSNHTEESRRGA